MYFELAVDGVEVGDLGWLLSKNPASTYANQLRCGRSVEGQWLKRYYFTFFFKELNKIFLL